uniref:Dynein regulatory complex subunit 4 n=1 Tax=Schistosoma haematobium TaxID=6185 RepID=A0A094ZUC6_SCHHA
MHEIRKDFERKMEEQKKIYMKNTKELKEKLDLQRKNELHETEERKNNHINALMRSHEKSYAEMKNYYNDITLNNLALINTLKEQLEERKKNEERLERRANEIAAENRRLVEPLNKAKEENTEMKRQMANYEKDKTQTKALLKTCEKEKKRTEWKYDILEQQFKHIEAERNDLYEKFVLAIQEVQQKCGLKNILLEKRLTALTETIEKKEAQLSEVLSASNLDPISMATVSRKLGDILDSRNGTIKELQYELARVCKAHNDLLLACESKLQQFGIPFQELGFRPLKTTLNTQKLGHGPAGLVSVPP